MSEQQTLDETRKAVYSPYLNYSVVTSSSVYDYLIRAYKKKLPLSWKAKEIKLENEEQQAKTR
jgi:hypothetical protein